MDEARRQMPKNGARRFPVASRMASRHRLGVTSEGKDAAVGFDTAEANSVTPVGNGPSGIGARHGPTEAKLGEPQTEGPGRLGSWGIGSEHLRDSDLAEICHVAIRNEAADEDRYVRESVLRESLEDPTDQRAMSTRENGDTDRLHIFLKRGFDNFFGCSPQPGVDDLKARVAERPRDHQRTPIVPVEAWFRHQNPVRRVGRRTTGGTSRDATHIARR